LLAVVLIVLDENQKTSKLSYW